MVPDLRGMPLREIIGTRPQGQSFVERLAVDGMPITASVGPFGRTAAVDSRDACDPQTVALVKRMFGRDLELCGYDFTTG